jgi:dTDP-4-amino-4,6-dideoxygalactose transaminase
MTARFVPAFPTLRPETLLRFGRDGVTRHHPFSEPDARYYYFARNAIWRAVKDLGLAGGEVLVPAYHHGVEIEALVDAGARVAFYAVGPRCEVDLADVARRIGPQTKALYLTHFLGFPGPAREMKRLAAAHGLPLLEDCALSLFSANGDEALGITGDVAIFCLYKVLAVPDGGVLVGKHSPANDSRRPPFASTLALATSSMLRNVALRGGRPGRALRRAILSLGKRALAGSGVEPVLAGTQHFSRADADLGCSLLTRHLLHLQDVPAIVSRRRRNYLFLQERLGDVAAPLFETLPAGVVPLCYPMRVEDNRRVAERLVARGIEAVDFWREGHPACDISAFPDVAGLRRSVLEVPCHQDLGLEALATVVDAIRDVLAAEPRAVRLFSAHPPHRSGGIEVAS